MCVKLYCLKLDGKCFTNNEPAADGTECGDNMVHKTLTSPLYFYEEPTVSVCRNVDSGNEAEINCQRNS